MGRETPFPPFPESQRAGAAAERGNLNKMLLSDLQRNLDSTEEHSNHWYRISSGYKADTLSGLSGTDLSFKRCKNAGNHAMYQVHAAPVNHTTSRATHVPVTLGGNVERSPLRPVTQWALPLAPSPPHPALGRGP